MKKIKVVVHKDGSKTVETSGYVGPECLKATAEFEQRLGRPDGEPELKPEYHAEEAREREAQREVEG